MKYSEIFSNDNLVKNGYVLKEDNESNKYKRKFYKDFIELDYLKYRIYITTWPVKQNECSTDIHVVSVVINKVTTTEHQRAFFIDRKAYIFRIDEKKEKDVEDILRLIENKIEKIWKQSGQVFKSKEIKHALYNHERTLSVINQM